MSYQGFRQALIEAGIPLTSAEILIEAGNEIFESRPLTNELLGMRTARRGDYRVLFTLDVEEHILYVHRIEHRSSVYKPR